MAYFNTKSQEITIKKELTGKKMNLTLQNNTKNYEPYLNPNSNVEKKYMHVYTYINLKMQILWFWKNINFWNMLVVCFLSSHYFYFMCMSLLFAGMSVPHMHAWCLRGQKRTLDPLELELPMAMSHHAGAGNSTHVLTSSGGAASALNH